MSDLLGDIVIDFPKTVTACHTEIRRLEGLLATADAQLDKKDDELQSTIDDSEERDAETDFFANDAINMLLDECERVGPLRYDVRQSDRTMRAIIALHDAVGRQP